MSRATLGFILEPVTLPLDSILPSRGLSKGISTSRKFKQIVASIEAVGLIEPLNVGKADKKLNQHVLLDGHIRLLALRQLGYVDAPCLIAKDDECHTYNSQINRLSTIQEHHMLRRAVERGVAPGRLAAALNVDISLIHRKVGLLVGICPEAADMLKDQHFSASLCAVMRKMKPARQMECAELMLTANNITVAYAEALLAATPPSLLVGGKRPRKLSGVTAEQMVKMEREMGNIQGQLKLVEESYRRDVMLLVLVQGYLGKLLNNTAVYRFLSRSQADVLAEFEKIVRMEALDGK